MISFITHVRNQPQIVAEHLRVWDRLDLQWEFVLIDDCSDKPLQISRPYLTILRSFDPMQWNYGVKNLGAQEAKYDWLLLTNADHVLTEEAARKIANLELLRKRVYKFMRFNPDAKDGRYNDRPHIGTLLIHREDLYSVGGYDEDFSGEYGHDDTFLWECLERAGCEPVLCPDIKLRNYSGNHNIPDADFRDYPEWSRDLTRNREILKRKRLGQYSASQPTVRFKWSKV